MRHMRGCCVGCGTPAMIASVATLALSGAARGQAFNLDIGVNSGIPSPTYAAAGLQPGIWQQILTTALFGGAPVALVNTAGAPTAVTLTCSTNNTNLNVNNPFTSGDDQALLDDAINLSFSAAPDTITISGLAAGEYHVTVYAWAPDNELYITGVNIDGQGVQPCGGQFAGLAQGVTHVSREVAVAADGGSFTIVFTTVLFESTLNGIQIRPLPVCPDPRDSPGDLDGDGAVDGVDLGILLLNFSQPAKAPGCGGESPCCSDLNGDGAVNGVDLGILLNNWTL